MSLDDPQIRSNIAGERSEGETQKPLVLWKQSIHMGGKEGLYSLEVLHSKQNLVSFEF